MNTNKIDLIKDWISKEQDGLMNAQGNFEYPEHEGAYHILCNLDAYIDSLKEEPVSEDLEEVAMQYRTDEFPSLCNGCKHIPIDAFKAGTQWQKQQDKQPINDDLEEASKNHAVERYRTTRDRELAEKCKWSFKAGAQWQKQQLMKDAVEAEITKISPNDHLRVVSDVLPLKDESEWGTKVKLIIIKQEKE